MMEDEIYETENVGQKHGDEDEIEDKLPPLCAAGGVFLAVNCSVEGLILRCGEG